MADFSPLAISSSLCARLTFSAFQGGSYAAGIGAERPRKRVPGATIGAGHNDSAVGCGVISDGRFVIRADLAAAIGLESASGAVSRAGSVSSVAATARSRERWTVASTVYIETGRVTRVFKLFPC
jgi:hypothetical protein